jgi:hypothetical protein
MACPAADQPRTLQAMSNAGTRDISNLSNAADPGHVPKMVVRGSLNHLNRGNAC